MTSLGAAEEEVDDGDSDFGTINNLDWLDTWLCAKGEALKGLVQTSLSSVTFHELRTSGRKRKRQPTAQAFLAASIEVVVCNLVRNILAPEAKGFIGYDRTKMKRKSRYTHPFYSPETLVRVVDWMEEYGALEASTGRPGMASFIAPTEWVKSIAGQHGVVLEDIGRSDQEEVIYLNRNTKSFDQKHTVTEHIEYEDNVETNAFREELRGLNTYLENANITFIDDGWGHVDVTAKRLKRYFSILERQAPRFDQHGRCRPRFREHVRQPCLCRGRPLVA